MLYIFWAPRGEIIIPSVFCVKRDVVLLQRTINRRCLEIGCAGYLYISESNVRIASFYIYIYIYGAPFLDASRSHTTTHHSR